MTQNIEEDHKHFRDVVRGKIQKSLKPFIGKGKFLGKRGKNGKMGITIPQIDTPRFVFGDNGNQGVGRGQGDKGKVIGKYPIPGDGSQEPGDEHVDGIEVMLDMNEILDILQQELELPNLQPKPNNIYEEIKIKYNDISLVGPNSLRHNRKTLMQAMKRAACMDTLENTILLPGQTVPIRTIIPERRDMRYRQYKEIKIRANNAAIFFCRDGSGSMDDYKCDIVSDLCYWINGWISRYYDKTERIWVWHDTVAQEMTENQFYKTRQGGGTMCSSAFDLVVNKIENVYTPDKWNIYVFYFGDGENWTGDNVKCASIIKSKLNSNVVNLLGMVEILSGGWGESLKKEIDVSLADEIEKGYIRTTAVPEKQAGHVHWGYKLEDRESELLRAIKDLLGKTKVK